VLGVCTTVLLYFFHAKEVMEIETSPLAPRTLQEVLRGQPQISWFILSILIMLKGMRRLSPWGER
jgi:ABC-type phosphate/phosphonate transport system permease subunit